MCTAVLRFRQSRWPLHPLDAISGCQASLIKRSPCQSAGHCRPQRSISVQKSRLSEAYGAQPLVTVQAGHKDSADMASTDIGVLCQQWHSKGRCLDGECEGLHVERATFQNLNEPTVSASGRLIVAAGPERSGSTWLFNAIRLLYQAAGRGLHPYWLHTVTDRKLQHRHCGQPGAPDVLIKTHRWSGAWDAAAYPDAKIFLTHRDLSGVVSSYQRVGWAFDIPDSYVEEHQRWRSLAHKDVAFEDILGQPEKELEDLAAHLNLTEQVDIHDVQQNIQSLKAPHSGPPDPITKLWARHLSPEVLAKQAGSGGPVDSGSAASESQLRHRFPEYHRQYGY